MEEESVSMGVCRLLKKSDKSVYVNTPDFGYKWVPNKVIHDDSDLHEKCTLGFEGELKIKESWLSKL
jgi:hypothetical protein